MKRFFLLMMLGLLCVGATAQNRLCRPSPLLFPGDSARFDSFLRKLDTLVLTGRGKVKIVHVGGSHVQGGMWTDRLRRNFLSLRYGLDGGRGLVFPFAAAQTNTPSSYRSCAFGNWSATRCLKPEGRLGLCGMGITAVDSASVLVDLVPKDRKFGTPGYSFRRVDVLGYGNMEPVLIYGRDTLRGTPEKSHWHFELPSYREYVRVGFSKPYGTFTLTGLYLDKDSDGLTFSEAGVNGASTHSWLRCEDWERDLREMGADLVIFSVGINDIQGTDFDAEAFYERYHRLAREALRANPGCTFLFTTLSDSYFHHRQPNVHGVAASAAIIRLAAKYNAAVWDLFSVMGGLGSVDGWAQAGLATADRVHFTGEGYSLLGDLLFDAIMDRYQQVCR